MKREPDPDKGEQIRRRGDRLALASITCMGLAVLAFIAGGGLTLAAGAMDQIMESATPIGELSWDAARRPLALASGPAILSIALLTAAWVIEIIHRRDIAAWAATLQRP